jgi:hypothetical protein
VVLLAVLAVLAWPAAIGAPIPVKIEGPVMFAAVETIANEDGEAF